MRLKDVFILSVLAFALLLIISCDSQDLPSEDAPEFDENDGPGDIEEIEYAEGEFDEEGDENSAIAGQAYGQSCNEFSDCEGVVDRRGRATTCRNGIPYRYANGNRIPMSRRKFDLNSRLRCGWQVPRNGPCLLEINEQDANHCRDEDSTCRKRVPWWRNPETREYNRSGHWDQRNFAQGQNEVYRCKSRIVNGGPCELNDHCQSNVCHEGRCVDEIPEEVVECTGETPANSNLCSGDDQNLAENMAKALAAACTDEVKCEYTCSEGYHFEDGACVEEVCVDDDLSPNDPISDIGDKHVLGTVTGHNTVLDDDPIQDYCDDDGRLMQVGCGPNGNLIRGVSDCPGDEFCHEGVCTDTMFLDSCKQDGWEPGRSYKLASPIEAEEGSTCIKMDYSRSLGPNERVQEAFPISYLNITFDCQGHSISEANQAKTGLGIYLEGVRGVTIKNCEIFGFFSAVKLQDSILNTIRDNVIHSTEAGIYLSSDRYARFWYPQYPERGQNVHGRPGFGNKILSNKIYDVDGWGINAIRSSPNISGNSIRDVGGEGILVQEGSHNSGVFGNNITNAENGILVRDSSNLNIHNNDANLNRNWGIYVFESVIDVFGLSFSENTANNNGDSGIVLWSTRGFRVNNNTACSNSNLDFKCPGSSRMVGEGNVFDNPPRLCWSGTPPDLNSVESSPCPEE